MSAAAIRLHLLPDVLDEGGEARAALELPAAPGRRAVVVLFPSVAAAVAAKMGLERTSAIEARHMGATT